MDLPTPTKFCPTCRQTKPRDQFRRHRLTADGYESQCKSCRLPLTDKKKCCTCKKRKDRSEFYRNSKLYDGLTPQCKRCKSRIESARYHARKAARQSQPQHKEP